MEKQYYTLSNQVKIPAIGFGTWQIPQGETAYNSVMAALKAGSRHIDTAMAYGNEESVGKAIKDSKIKREDIFVTTKLPAEIKGYQQALDAFNKSLNKLGLDYIDLYLIHAPKPWGKTGSGMEYMDLNIESWKAFEKLYEEGKVRSIGVSNFLPMHLEKLLSATSIVPMVNQILINPGTIPHDNIAYCREHNILLEAYSPLATGRIFELKYLEDIASKYQKTVAQLCIRWSYQNGFLPLPKSQTESRIIENLKIFDFTIDPEDMDRIGKI
jgi:diketogulonate reductase-like aldo/keto reductase